MKHGTDSNQNHQTVARTFASLPASARNRWKADFGSGTTINDDVGTADATLNGGSWVSDSNAQGDYKLSLDGTSDYIGLTKLGNFGSNLTTDWAFAVTIDTTTTPSGGAVLGAQSSSDGSGGTAGDATTIRNNAIDDTTLDFNMTDQGNDTLNVETSSLDSNFSDGNKHRYVYNKTSNSASGLEIWQDTAQQSMTTNKDQAFDNPIDFDMNPVQLGRMQFNGGYDTDYLDVNVDDPIIYSDSLSRNQIQDDYNLQPWV
jgi:hypothetical protein